MKRTTAVSAAILLFALTLLFGVASASAADFSYRFLGSLAETPGSGPGEFETLGRMAIDEETGNLYVVDRGNDRVQVFAPDGDSATYLTEVTAGLDNPFGIAIEQSSGPADEIDLYISDAGNSRIVKLTSDGGGTPSFSADPSFTSPALGAGAAQVGDFQAALAVDQAAGDLLVADPGNDLVKRFDSSGAHISSFDGSTSPGGAFVGPTDIATAPNGDIYLVDAEGPVWEGGEGATNRSRVERFDSAGAHLATISALGYTGFGVVAFDPDTNQVVTGDVAPSSAGTSIWRPGGGHIGTFVTSNPPYWNTLPGLAVGGPDGHLYIGANPGLSEPPTAIVVYEPAALPTVAIDPPAPGSITDSSAELSGSVNPEGFEASWHFEYQEDGDLGWQSIPVPDESAGAGTTDVEVDAEIAGLQANTLYHARLKATNDAGFSYSDVVSFTTDAAVPTVTTRWAAPRTTTTARLNGYVNPRNSEATYYFEYGTTTAYGTSVPLSEDSAAGDGRTPVLAYQAVTGLSPDTTYHYRLVAVNQAGRTDGDDMTFTTRSTTEPGPPVRGVELVNNPDKGNQNALTFDVSPDSDRVLWGVPGGAPGSPLGANGSFISERTETGWKSRSLLPPVEELFGGGDYRYDLLASSADFSRFLFDATEGFLSLTPHTLVRLDTDGNHETLTEFPPITETQRSVVSEDLSRIFINTREQFDPSHTPGVGNVYDVGTGTPELVSAMPGTNLAPVCGVQTTSINDTGFGGTRYPWIAEGSASRAYFKSQGDECLGIEHLYVRDLDEDETTLISAPALSGPDFTAEFVRTNRSGSAVIYISQSVLDPDDQNQGRDIYRYSEADGNECLTCVVPNAQISELGGAESGVAVSDDFSMIYFVSYNALVPGEGRSGVPNLYLLEDGEIEYIAPSSEAGQSMAAGGLTPDGNVLIFPSSAAEITADDNGGMTQYYRYDHRDGSVECVSCPAGRAPIEDVSDGLVWLDFRGRSALTDDGSSIAFVTGEALVPEDINGEPDIYEWLNGKRRLVTDGETKFPPGTNGVSLHAGSSDGKNIVFSASAKLTGHEIDDAVQVFNARAGGGFPPPPEPPAPCDGDSCQGPLGAAPHSPHPASGSFTGPANQGQAKPKPKRCAAGKRAKRVKGKKRCVKRKGEAPGRGKRSGARSGRSK